MVVFRDPGGWLPPAFQEKRSAPLQALRNGLVFVGLAPDPAKQHLIKRVIGVGGDRIVCCDAAGALVINGKPVKEKYLYEGNVPSEMKFDVTVPEHVESVRNEVQSALGRVDGVLHAIGFAPEACLGDDFLAAQWPDVAIAMQISARVQLEWTT